MNTATIMKKLQGYENYHGRRAFSELNHLYSISLVSGNCYEDRLQKAASALLDAAAKAGAVTADMVVALEQELSDLSPAAKSYTLHMVSHAHIDMDWFWGYHETVAATLETFRTTLKLMEEYPDFTFSQSQASVYEIVAKYDPDMLEEIKRRVHEGRWELSATTWVEGDKNMSSGEAQCRQILHTKKYLAKLFDIDPDTLRLDFEPDTFGHNVYVPEVLQNAGVDWMYHCRGCDLRDTYRWRAPSGKEILVFQEPKWYIHGMDPVYMSDYPKYCARVGDGSLRHAMMVYGVGDHGGGPTRRDIEIILDTMTWPLFPTVIFSRYDRFYSQLEEIRESLPVYEGELNFLLDGCYTTQTRLKMANALGEKRLYDADAVTAMASLAGAPVKNEKLLEEGWKNVLFSQFHDILPGSCNIDSREYSMGLFQQTLAAANTSANTALRSVIANIDTSAIDFNDDKMTVSEGAGVGYHMSNNFHYPFSFTERGRGSVRAWHIFNTTAYDRCEYAEVLLWDYPGDIRAVSITDSEGRELEFTVSQEKVNFMQFHFVAKLLVKVNVPAFGYTTCILHPKDEVEPSLALLEQLPGNPRRMHRMGDQNYVLENDYIRAEFHFMTCQLISLVDKATGTELAGETTGCFEYVKEAFPKTEDSAWTTGPAIDKRNLNMLGNVHVTDYYDGKPVNNKFYSTACCDHVPVRTHDNIRDSRIASLSYNIGYKSSTVTVTVRLYPDKKHLEYDVIVDWVEAGSQAQMPALRFLAEPGYLCSSYRYSVASGQLERPAYTHDVPSLGSMECLPEDKEQPVYLHLFADAKYGFRGYEGDCGVQLIRSSINPDPHPDLGRHYTKLFIGIAGDAAQALRQRTCQDHPLLPISATGHTGKLALDGKLLDYQGCCTVTALYQSEKGVFLRLFNPTDNPQNCAIAGYDVSITNTLEQVLQKLERTDGKTEFTVPAHSYTTLLLK